MTLTPFLPFLRILWLLLIVSVILVGCGRLPNPVEITDGQVWIPIGDTAFLVPEKIWLKSYARKSTDGMVDSFNLHAMAPEVLPWSKAVHSLMYPKNPPGLGRLIIIYIRSTEQDLGFHQRFPVYPQSLYGKAFPLMEEPSDLTAQGLHRFREQRGSDGTYWPDWVFYEYVQDGKVKYLVRCDDHRSVLTTDSCTLIFPYAGKFEVTLTFQRAYMADSVNMADKVAEKIKEFEAAGQARLAWKVSK